MSLFKKAVIGALAALFVPIVAMAEGNLHAGPLEFHPYVSAREAYSNNVYATPDSKRRDWYTATTLGLKLDLPFREHKAEVGYNAVLTRYAQYDAENTTDHNAHGLLDFKIGSLIGLKLTEAYSKGHEPRGASSTGFIERYKTTDAAASLTYQLVDISKVRFDYSQTTWDFRNSEFRNRHEDTMSGYVYLKFLPKTSGFVEYDHTYVDYNDRHVSQNSEVDGGSLGLTWDITDSSGGTVKAGYQRKNFAVKTMKDYGTWTASVDMNHDFTDYTALTLAASRKLNETTLRGSRYILSTGASAELRHVFLTKFTGLLHGTYGKDKFSDIVEGAEGVRKDVSATYGAGVNYQMQDWLGAGLDYNHKHRNSNENANDFDENTYSISLNFAL